MGKILEAFCRNCNFEKTFYLGGGKYDFKTVSRAPGINKKSGEFVEANFYNKSNFDIITFYNEPGMYLENDIDSNFVLSWDIRLNIKNSLCPRCQKFEMQFSKTGNFD